MALLQETSPPAAVSNLVYSEIGVRRRWASGCRQHHQCPRCPDRASACQSPLREARSHRPRCGGSRGDRDPFRSIGGGVHLRLDRERVRGNDRQQAAQRSDAFAAGSGAASTPRQARLTPPVTGAPESHATSELVTLITGDRVLLSAEGGDHYAVTPLPRADGATPSMQVTTVGGARRATAVYAVPADASAMILNGRVDRDLFNVVALAADHDTGSSATIPVLLHYADHPSGAELARRARQLPATTLRATFTGRSAVQVNVAGSRADRFWAALTAGQPATSLLPAHAGGRLNSPSLAAGVTTIGLADNAGATTRLPLPYTPVPNAAANPPSGSVRLSPKTAWNSWLGRGVSTLTCAARSTRSTIWVSPATTNCGSTEVNELGAAVRFELGEVADRRVHPSRHAEPECDGVARIDVQAGCGIRGVQLPDAGSCDAQEGLCVRAEGHAARLAPTRRVGAWVCRPMDDLGHGVVAVHCRAQGFRADNGADNGPETDGPARSCTAEHRSRKRVRCKRPRFRIPAPLPPVGLQFSCGFMSDSVLLGTATHKRFVTHLSDLVRRVGRNGRVPADTVCEVPTREWASHRAAGVPLVVNVTAG